MSEICECEGARTRALVHSNNNTCTACSKKLIDETLLNPPPVEVLQGGENKDDLLKSLIEALSKAMIGSVKERNDQIKFKLPTYNGSTDVTHFFHKLNNYLEVSKISKETEKIRVLKQCLEDVAFDLFLSLEKHLQEDFSAVEEKMNQYFAPQAHNIIETKAFMDMKKSETQTVANFHIKVKKKAAEILATTELVKIVLFE